MKGFISYLLLINNFNCNVGAKYSKVLFQILKIISREVQIFVVVKRIEEELYWVDDEGWL